MKFKPSQKRFISPLEAFLSLFNKSQNRQKVNLNVCLLTQLVSIFVKVGFVNFI